MMFQIRKNAKQLKSLAKSLPMQPVRDHILKVLKQIFDLRLYETLRYQIQVLLQRMLTDYFEELITCNQIFYAYNQPLAVHFGDLLPMHFVCYS